MTSLIPADAFMAHGRCRSVATRIRNPRSRSQSSLKLAGGKYYSKHEMSIELLRCSNKGGVGLEVIEVQGIGDGAGKAALHDGAHDPHCMKPAQPAPPRAAWLTHSSPARSGQRRYRSGAATRDSLLSACKVRVPWNPAGSPSSFCRHDVRLATQPACRRARRARSHPACGRSFAAATTRWPWIRHERRRPARW